jgi:hypothetical protein
VRADVPESVAGCTPARARAADVQHRKHAHATHLLLSALLPVHRDDGGRGNCGDRAKSCQRPPDGSHAGRPCLAEICAHNKLPSSYRLLHCWHRAALIVRMHTRTMLSLAAVTPSPHMKLGHAQAVSLGALTEPSIAKVRQDGSHTLAIHPLHDNVSMLRTLIVQMPLKLKQDSFTAGSVCAAVHLAARRDSQADYATPLK